MFTVLFEVHPDPNKQSLYLDIAKALKPELLRIDGFIDNIRYKSLTREGWILSLSTWRDEKALVRWRTQARHHDAQSRGRQEVLLDYHLRICEVTHDSHVPEGHEIKEERLDVTRVGHAEAVVLVGLDATGLRDADKSAVLSRLGLDLEGVGDLLDWDVYDAVLDPGDVLAYLAFRTGDEARTFSTSLKTGNDTRLRHQRVIRDYGMRQRDEAPQYYPEAPKREQYGEA